MAGATRCERWAAALWLSAALLQIGCGARTPIEDSCQAATLEWRRAELGAACALPDDGPGLLVIASEDDWSEHCTGDDDAPLDFEREALIVVYLEGGCAHSGCSDRVELIESVQAAGCETTVQARVELEPGELGACHACAQPRDVIIVSRPAPLDNVTLE